MHMRIVFKTKFWLDKDSMGVDCNCQKITQSYINNRYEKNEC